MRSQRRSLRTPILACMTCFPKACFILGCSSSLHFLLSSLPPCAHSSIRLFVHLYLHHCPFPPNSPSAMWQFVLRVFFNIDMCCINALKYPRVILPNSIITDTFTPYLKQEFPTAHLGDVKLVQWWRRYTNPALE